MKGRMLFIVLFLCSLLYQEARASHIVGGEVSYKYLGFVVINDTTYYKYQVSLSIYEDCFTGQHSAILADDPAFLSAYDGMGNIIQVDTNVHYVDNVLVPSNFNNACITNPPTVCLLKKTFVKNYLLKRNTTGYLISYQRCCRNATIVNIFDPGDIGATYYCTIPPPSVAAFNNSAVFKNYPPQIICINNPLLYDHSATDADGDSLSYEFCTSYKGANNIDIKPIPTAPPYDSVNYINPFSSKQPMAGMPPIQINPVTGMITGTPNRMGRYLVNVCCHEWRGGHIINTVSREFQFVVTNCSKAVVADIPQYSSDINTYVVDCKNYTVSFINTSTGGTTYHWDFGVPSVTSDTSDLFQPVFTFPDTGTFVVKLIVNPQSTCMDSIWRYVKVYPTFITGFADTGHLCPNAPVGFIDQTMSTFKPLSSWTWSFGDGESSVVQNPIHSFLSGGTYNVMLIAVNQKNCVDTAVQQVTIENFKPFAGNDTVIVKGESIVFDASGGTYYLWSPATNLNLINVSNPTGYYTDTGTFYYTVFVESAYGCSGYDTVKVQVVNSPAFFVPSAFSPNNDGLNDNFRPKAIGFKQLNYFRVFDRWGQMVFFTDNFETGWDGTFNGKACEMGTYFYEMQFIDRYGNPGKLKGDVTLVR